MRKHPLLAFATATSFAFSSAISVGPGAFHDLKISGRSVAVAVQQINEASATSAALTVLVPAIAAPRASAHHRLHHIRSKPQQADRLLQAGVTIGPVPAQTPATQTPPTQTPPAPVPAVKPAELGGVWRSLRMCESGDNYAENTGNGYYGAYQFTLASWRSVGFSGLPSQASPTRQDAAAQLLLARAGWQSWPACSIALGLR